MEGVKMWLSSLAADFFNTGIQKLGPRHDSWLNSGVATLFTLLVLLAARQKLLSKYPPYFRLLFMCFVSRTYNPP
jgi:hypothetical protein